MSLPVVLWFMFLLSWDMLFSLTLCVIIIIIYYIMYCHTLPADDTLTIDNLCEVTSSVKDWKSLRGYHYGLCVPDHVSACINQKEKTTMLQYFLDNVPMASWQKVAGVLYYMGEKTALEAVKKFLKVTPGQSAVLS